MKKTDFVHLHAHSEYSLLDGAVRLADDRGKPSEFLKAMASWGMPALALTDHGNLFGAIEFYENATAVGLRPILGCEAYLASGSRLDRGARAANSIFHLTLLSQDFEGYQNLMALVSRAYLEGFYYKPRMDKELLGRHRRGLVALSGCLNGEIPQALSVGDLDKAVRLAGEYGELFGKGNFYLELMDHGMKSQKQVLEGLLEVARKTGLPTVATNDCHYFRKEDAEAHDILLCIGTGKRLEEENRLRYETPEFYYKSPAEMLKTFSFCPEALESTVEIAERCRLEIPLDQLLLPHYEVPAGYTAEGYLEELCWKGLRLRLGSRDQGPYPERLRYELEILRRMGFSSYFLIVWDFIRYAREQGIPVGPGRGSGAGSLVAYVLEITDVDPIAHRLLFERFLNPERRSMPDLDIDFSDAGRDRVIEYVRNKYGLANVAQIITFGSMHARLVVRDVGRVLGIPLPVVDRLAKLVPPGVTLHQALQNIEELKGAQRSDPQIRRLFDISRRLEGLKRHTGVHAAGTVITRQEVVRYSPLAKSPNSEVVTTQYNDESLLKLGLLKIDFLGLRTLTILSNAVEGIRRFEGRPDFDFKQVGWEDPKTYELLCQAKTFGVFQLESPGMRDLLRRLKPGSFQDVVALIALYRPGPMGSGMLDEFVLRKHDPSRIRYDHPQLEPILKETYGTLVFQEQVMEIAQRLAGFAPGQADVLRKAMGKKIPEELEQTRSAFVEGCAAKKIFPKLANKIFDSMVTFGGYGFNKCVVGATQIMDAKTGYPWTVRQLYTTGNKIHVWSLTNRGKCVPRLIGRVWSNGCKPVYKLCTALGKEIRVTDNHPFYTFHGWRALRDLKPGDRIAAPRMLPSTSISHWPHHQLALLGWVLSEGNTCHPAGFYVYTTNPDQAEDMISAVQKFKHTATTTRRRRGLFEIYVRADTTRDGQFRRGRSPWNKGLSAESQKTYQGTREVSGAREWLDSLGLSWHKATAKFIPPVLFELFTEDLAIFLGRLWSGDGFLISQSNTVPFYATSSPRMARDLQDILLRLGMVSRIARKTYPYRAGFKKGFAVYLIGRESIEAFLRKVGPHLVGRQKQLQSLQARLSRVKRNLTSKDTVPVAIRALVRSEKVAAGLTWKGIESKTGICVSEFSRCVGNKKGFRRWTLRILADHFASPELRQHVESDIYWDTVSRIEREGVEETYDLEVPNTHNFLADGLFVHNSHATAYGVLAYQTAYLKANFPLQYMAALLTSEIGRSAVAVEGKENKMVTYLQEAAAMGIPVFPPEVQKSEGTFQIETQESGVRGIRFGLLGIKNVGEAAVDTILQSRRVQGPFRSLADLCARIDTRQANKKVLESLICAGALDSLGSGEKPQVRGRLLKELSLTLARTSRYLQEMRRGQGMLFAPTPSDGASEGVPDHGAVPLSEHDLLKGEREVLGFYLSGHPLARCRKGLKLLASCSIGELPKQQDARVRLAGMIVSVRRLISKKRREPWARFRLEDMTGEVEVLVFPKSYAQGLSRHLQPHAFVTVAGRVQGRGEQGSGDPLLIREWEVVAEEILPLERALDRCSREVTVTLENRSLESDLLQKVRAILERYPGSAPFSLRVPTRQRGFVLIDTGLTVGIRSSLLEELDQVLGENTWEIANAS
ncbi:MAG: DNA polymerase III subunit alpha [Elusimicrobia bacterium]|nr:DNA polymerase III subunit alpha [Elusimicrobiota bacterium]